MSSDTFYFKSGKSFSFLVWKRWEKQGIFHGFSGKDLDFSPDNKSLSTKKLLKEGSAESLFLLDQVHSKDVIDLNRYDSIQENLVGDAIITNNCPGIVYGVKTADCVPVIIKAHTQWALVHAGWRGLSRGVIEETLKHLPDTTELEVVIGPCAGENDYEVRDDVISAFAKEFAFKINADGKKFLSLPDTTAKKILKIRPYAKVAWCGISTVSSPVFHSFRREKENSGRNLAFVMPKKPW